jgi:hypothetical protein
MLGSPFPACAAALWKTRDLESSLQWKQGSLI